MAVLAYGALWLVAQWLRALRAVYLLRPLAKVASRHVIDVALVGSAALLVFPMRMGELVRPVMMRRHGVSALAMAATVGLERIVDGLFVGGILFVGLVLDPGDVHRSGGMIGAPQLALIPVAARLALLGFAGALAMMALFYWRRDTAQRLVQLCFGWFSLRLADWLSEVLARLASGLQALGSWRCAAQYLLCTAAFWCAYVLGIGLILRGSSLGEIGFAQTLTVTGLLSLGFLLPAPPGFFGAFQTTYYAGLSLYVAPERVQHQGAAAVFATYVLQVGLTLLVGAVSLWRERRSSARGSVSAGAPDAPTA